MGIVGGVVRILLVGPVVVLVLLFAAPAASAVTAPFSGSCPPVPSPNGDRICSGQVPSFDGTSLDVDLTQPARDTGNSHPLIVMLHGFGNTKHEWESTTNQGDGADKYHWNSHWFAEHGYYVLTYTARGFNDGGPDRPDQPPTPSFTSAVGARAQIHLKSRETEIKDTQWLAALMAYSFPAIDPSRVAVTGGSYGGGESWTQASQAQWTFPHEADPKHDLPVLDLQVAVPKYPWTDLAYSLAPNGHPGPWPYSQSNQQPATGQPPAGYCDVDQSLDNDPCYSSSQGHPNNNLGEGNPVGVVKASYVNVFFTYGHDLANGGGFQAEDACDTQPPPASPDAWYTRVFGPPGEPYDTAGVEDPLVAQLRHGLTECRASYYQDEGWQAQADGPRRVAVFSIQGWTDDLFTPVESFRQFKYLKSLNPKWPVEVALADIGHPRAKNNPDTWRYLNQQAWQWMQSHIHRSHDQQTTVSSQETVCANAQDQNDPNRTLTAKTPEDLSHGKISITYTGSGTTSSAQPDPNGPVDDPVANAAAGQIIPRPGNCPVSAGPAPYTGISQPLQSERTYVGFGSVTVPYTLTGTTAQLDARVWDIPPGPAANQAGSTDCQNRPTPDGCPLLITRGTYRLDFPAYDALTGEIRIPFFGNQYTFRPGHKIRLDLTQQDTPYLRVSDAPSTIKIEAPTLNLPTRNSGTSTLDGMGVGLVP